MKAFLIDLNKCVGCYDCQIGCKDEHCGNDWSPYAKPQPDTGQFWMHLLEEEHGARPHVKVSYIPVMCQHCENPACAAVCDQDALVTRDDGLVLLLPEKCNGCGKCVDACPYGAIFMNQELGIAQKCTGCAHLIDRGFPIDHPRCVDNCHMDVIQYGEETELDLADTETLHPEYGLKTRVYYRGLPKRFIAGKVYDPETEEVVIGAIVTAKSTEEGATFSARTDAFGDFWLRQLPETDFELSIHGGGKSYKGTVSTKEKSIGMGNIALQ